MIKIELNKANSQLYQYCDKVTCWCVLTLVNHVKDLRLMKYHWKSVNLERNMKCHESCEETWVISWRNMKSHVTLSKLYDLLHCHCCKLEFWVKTINIHLLFLIVYPIYFISNDFIILWPQFLALKTVRPSIRLWTSGPNAPTARGPLESSQSHTTKLQHLQFLKYFIIQQFYVIICKCLSCQPTSSWSIF